MKAKALLPAGFEALAPFVAFWCVETSAERSLRRDDSTDAQRVAFFGAMKDRIADALALLDAKPLAAFDEEETRLMQLALSFAHVALAVEVQGDDEAKHAQSRRFMKITQAPADVRLS